MMTSSTAFAVDEAILLAEPPTPPSLIAEISYYGETIAHGGVGVGVDYVLRERAVRLARFEQEARFKRTQYFVGGEAAVYRHRGNHLGVLIGPRAGMRRLTARSFIFEGMLGAGYFHKRLDGVTFVVNDAGELEETRRKGRPKFAASVSFGLGRQMVNLLDGALSWYVRPGVFFEVPHNTTVLPHPTVQLGLSYRLR